MSHRDQNWPLKGHRTHGEPVCGGHRACPPIPCDGKRSQSPVWPWLDTDPVELSQVRDCISCCPANLHPLMTWLSLAAPLAPWEGKFRVTQLTWLPGQSTRLSFPCSHRAGHHVPPSWNFSSMATPWRDLLTWGGGRTGVMTATPLGSHVPASSQMAPASYLDGLCPT